MQFTLDRHQGDFSLLNSLGTFAAWQKLDGIPQVFQWDVVKHYQGEALSELQRWLARIERAWSQWPNVYDMQPAAVHERYNELINLLHQEHSTIAQFLRGRLLESSILQPGDTDWLTVHVDLIDFAQLLPGKLELRGWPTPVWTSSPTLVSLPITQFKHGPEAMIVRRLEAAAMDLLFTDSTVSTTIQAWSNAVQPLYWQAGLAVPVLAPIAAQHAIDKLHWHKSLHGHSFWVTAIDENFIYERCQLRNKTKGYKHPIIGKNRGHSIMQMLWTCQYQL